MGSLLLEARTDLYVGFSFGIERYPPRLWTIEMRRFGQNVTFSKIRLERVLGSDIDVSPERACYEKDQVRVASSQTWRTPNPRCQKGFTSLVHFIEYQATLKFRCCQLFPENPSVASRSRADFEPESIIQASFPSHASP